MHFNLTGIIWYIHLLQMMSIFFHTPLPFPENKALCPKPFARGHFDEVNSDAPGSLLCPEDLDGGDGGIAGIVKRTYGPESEEDMSM